MDTKLEAEQWTPVDWIQKIGLASQDQLPQLIYLLTREHDEEHWRAKLIAAIRGLTKKSSLEVAGKALTLEQLKVIFKQGENDRELLDKLPPLLVGISPNIFRGLLLPTPQSILLTLKQEVFTEALQHHLKILSQELDLDLVEQYRLIDTKYQEINSLNLEDITKQDIEKIVSGWHELRSKAEALKQEIALVLALAWNSGRTDLVAELSQLKEQSQKLLFNIGWPGTGLWEFLESKLNLVFVDPAFPLNALKNEDLSLDALTRLRIWYPEDYWEIGLLPDISRQELETHSENKERLRQQEQLFKAVQNHLEKLGLRTVGDLKEASIYSRKGLKEYIQAHQITK